MCAQCLTDFSKLIPEPSVDVASGFGNSVSMYDNYIAVGIPYDDSLGRATGIVHIYEFVEKKWDHIAVMAPSDPVDGMRFGLTVKLTQEYLLVGAQVGGGRVYLLKKSVMGWVSGTEQTTFSYPETSYFGIHSNKGLAVSMDQKTIAITDPYYHTGSMPLSRSGAIFVYYKSDVNADWDGSITPAIILSPEDDCQDFSSAGVAMYGNKLATSTPYTPTGIGRIYIYSDASPGFQNSMLEARLDPGDPNVFNSRLFGAVSLAYTQDGIFVTAIKGVHSDRKFGIYYFEAPQLGTWSDTNSPTCFIEGKPDDTISNTVPFSISTNGLDLFASVRDTNGKGYLHIIRKGMDEWCSPSYELVDQFEAPQPPLSNRYAQVFAVNQTASSAVMGFVPHPESTTSMVALRALNKEGDTWKNQTLYSTKKSTTGHFYGRHIVGFDDYMFVTAPHDGTVKPGAGAVYSYKKVDDSWEKTGRILPPLGQSQYDNSFGLAIGSNKNYLAISASNDRKGKIFMYKKASNDWGSVELVQEVTIPEEGLTVYAYGDNVALDDEWLLVPYVQNSPVAIIYLAVFKFNGQTWDFRQVVEIGHTNVLSGNESTISVAIENGVIVAANKILELNANGSWELKYSLSPSDPEPIQISPDFTHLVSNGSSFGYSVAIHDNIIFIGAPTRDYEGTWDVGAVYVYTKEPNESWSSRTETTKLVPRVKEENELFGYSLKALYNTLVVGAPGNDYNKNNTPRNKPGRAYIFQAEDYLWKNVNPLIDFTGDSFEKDYYGISVYLDETDFFIGAALEDIESGKLSGTVYVTPTPPILKLRSPVCQSDGLVRLFGYPFGGTWSGPGMVDAKEGTFDPVIAGTGIHTFTYITESCTFPGVLQVQVYPPVQALLLIDEKQYVCNTDNSIAKVLSVQPEIDTQYQWFYRVNNSDEFIAISNAISSSMTATQRGEYRVRVKKDICSVYSSIVSIQNEVVHLQTDSIGSFCNNLSENIVLNATPHGGQWNGLGISNNVFNPKNIPAGTHPLTYTLNTSAGCRYRDTIFVQIFQSFEPIITTVSGSFCDTGSAVLGITETVLEGMKVDWLMLDLNQNEYFTVFENTDNINLSSHGTFKVMISNQICESLSEAYVVQPRDTLFVPNVFTPNGDGLNEVFEVITNQKIVSIDVYNRYGNSVFSGNGSYWWDGADIPTGVYYWLITYISCLDQQKTAKGWVHLIR